jgi:hypothetical protein
MANEYQLTFQRLHINPASTRTIDGCYLGRSVCRSAGCGHSHPAGIPIHRHDHVESQQIPTELIQKMASSYVEERIEIIKQRVMTRENLLKIIEKYGLFKDSAKSLTVSEKVDEIRKHISIEPISANAKASGSR